MSKKEPIKQHRDWARIIRSSVRNGCIDGWNQAHLKFKRPKVRYVKHCIENRIDDLMGRIDLHPDDLAVFDKYSEVLEVAVYALFWKAVSLWVDRGWRYARQDTKRPSREQVAENILAVAEDFAIEVLNLEFDDCDEE